MLNNALTMKCVKVLVHLSNGASDLIKLQGFAHFLFHPLKKEQVDRLQKK